MRDKYINYLEYFYQEHYDPEMDNILIEHGASEDDQQRPEGFYTTMTDSDLREACSKFYSTFGGNVPGARFLYYSVMARFEWDNGFIEGYMQAYKDLGKDITELEEKIGL